MKKAFITVIGSDKVGIIYHVTKTLMENKINILEISQTILDGNFTMIMSIDVTDIEDNFEQLSSEFQQIEEEIGVKINLQHEDIFNVMHNI